MILLPHSAHHRSIVGHNINLTLTQYSLMTPKPCSCCVWINTHLWLLQTRSCLVYQLLILIYDSYILTACGLTVHTWIMYITTNTQSHFVGRQKLPRRIYSHHTIQTNTWHRPQAPRRVGGDGALRGCRGGRGRSRPAAGPQAQEISLFKYDWLIFFFIFKAVWSNRPQNAFLPGHTRLEETLKQAMYWTKMRPSVQQLQAVWILPSNKRSIQVMVEYHSNLYWNNPLENVMCRPDWSTKAILWKALCVDLIGLYTIKAKISLAWFKIVKLIYRRH
jgi:hypothetical protein